MESPLSLRSCIGTMNFRPHGVPASAGLATRSRLKAELHTNIGSWKELPRLYAVHWDHETLMPNLLSVGLGLRWQLFEDWRLKMVDCSGPRPRSSGRFTRTKHLQRAQ